MSLFFFTLLTLAVFSTASLPLEKLLQNPKLFAAAFANADPSIVDKMIGLVDKLLSEGQDDKQSAIDDHTKRAAEQDAAQSAFDSAYGALDAVSKSLVEAETIQDNLIALEKEHKGQLDAAVIVLHSADSAKTSAQSHMDSTKKRVKAEHVALEDVKDKLESIKPQGRRLLSDADPKAVNKVIAEIQKLIEAGVKEEQDALAALNDATIKQAEAAKAEDAARKTHESTVGKLGTATNNVNSLTNEKAARLDEKNQAETKLADANSALASALEWMNQEVSRVKAEKATLEEVRELLEKNAS